MNNWEKYFGTPEKTAITLKNYTCDIDELIESEKECSICDLTDSCGKCPIEKMYCGDNLEWLQEEADDMPA